MFLPVLIRQTEVEPVSHKEKKRTPWSILISPLERLGVVAVEGEDADERAAAIARKNGGPGIKPGGVRKHKTESVDVQRKLAEESIALREFYEGTQGDTWVEHASWQKLLVQLRTPDGRALDLDRIASLPASEIEHFRDELSGVKALWVNRKVRRNKSFHFSNLI